MTNNWHHQLPALQSRLAGAAYLPDTPGYADEVAVFNGSVRHRPALAVSAANADDVRAAVTFASTNGLDVAVLNTGHGPSLPAGPTTLLISTKRMTRIALDVDAATARVEAGVRFGQLVDATAAVGLAPLTGSSPGVGVVGYTLSGGASSTMGRRYGWAADHVRSIDVVTADGQVRRVSPGSDAELYSALLGGRSNFGVVTAMEFTLFPVTTLYAGALFFAGEHLAAVLDAYRRFTATAPDDMSSGLVIFNFPPGLDVPPFMQGRGAVSLRVSYLGDSTSGAQLIEPLRQAAPVLFDTVTDMPFEQFASISGDPTDPSVAVEHFGLLREMTPQTIDAIVDVAGPQARNEINMIDIRHLQGAYRTPPPFPNAVGSRDAAFAYFALTFVPPHREVADYLDSGTELTEELRPWEHAQAHPTFQGPADATTSATRRAYDDATYRQLQAMKAKYDPTNMFRTNHNIPPVTAG
jgi:hypothetical protein